MKLGIDLGGTKIEGIVLDGGEVIWRKRIATPKEDYRASLQAISSLVQEGKRVTGISESLSIGIGTPGALTKAESGVMVMKNCNSVVLNGKPLKQDLEAILGCCVHLANDANCFALAETMEGAGKLLFPEQSPESMFGVILGTGVGGGVVVQGKLLNGLHSIAGEWGHNCLPFRALEKLPEGEQGRACYCGRQDCIETYLSGPGLALSYHLRYGEKLSSQEVVERMRAEDNRAKDIWQSYTEQLAVSLAQVVNILDPQAIILGGGMSNIEELYPLVGKLMAPHVFTPQAETPVVQAQLGDSAGVYGAAWLNS